MSDEKSLIGAYRRLWEGRAAAQQASSIPDIRSLAEDELADKMTHPRLRKSREAKFAEITARIRTSGLPDEDQDLLIRFYRSLMI
ncbi:hypothetical protein AV656_02825 [Bhargavaea cecembensis]|uniref:Uncharacterized protein n=1 Tax=Bhargavaea cecembensis TaxID=394098 RepID=A0A165HJN0_9BACL|nr:hypothetical protein [Bhargavaea cecembensis]KZE40218.1 hypothetical protein AV656_02825 [Bhargavaea cecembensis]